VLGAGVSVCTVIGAPAFLYGRQMDLLDSNKWLALDTETTGIHIMHGCKPFLVSTCTNGMEVKCWEWDVNPNTREPKVPHEDIEELNWLVQDLGYVIVFHNAKFDIRALHSIGVIVPRPFRILDTQLASHVCNSLESHKLKDLAAKYLDIPASDEEDLIKATHAARRVGKAKDWNLGKKFNGKAEVKADYWMSRAVDKRSKVCRKYAELDAVRTIRLMQMYGEVFENHPELIKPFQRELDLLPVIYDMETVGMSISKSTTNSLLAQYESRSEIQERICQSIVPINIRSPKQLQEVLYTPFGNKGFNLSCQEHTDTGQPATNQAALEGLSESCSGRSRRFLRHLLQYRANQSGVRYLKNYSQAELNGKLYPSFHQTGTNTTRLASSDPNAQNVSKSSKLPLRKVFGPKKGKTWVAIDYSQLELRLFAFISGEQSLIQSFEDGHDFHEFVATKIFNKPPQTITKEERRVAKNTNFSIIFGASSRKVNLTAGIPNAHELFANQFPNVKSFLETTIRQVQKDGYVKTLFGYQLIVPPEDQYKGVSYRVQGSAGDIIKNAMIKIKRSGLLEKYKCNIIAQIHDELVFEFDGKPTKRQVRDLKGLMEEAGSDLGVCTPTDAEIIETNWAQGKSLE